MSEDNVVITCRFGEKVKVDRSLLSSASSVDLTQNDIATQQPFYAVHSLVRLLQDGEKIQLTVDNLLDIYVAAKALKINCLENKLENFLSDKIGELSRDKSQMMKIDPELLKRLLSKTNTEPYWADVLFSWWTTDIRRRQKDFIRLVSDYEPHQPVQSTRIKSNEDEQQLCAQIHKTKKVEEISNDPKYVVVGSDIWQYEAEKLNPFKNVPGLQSENVVHRWLVSLHPELIVDVDFFGTLRNSISNATIAYKKVRASTAQFGSRILWFDDGTFRRLTDRGLEIQVGLHNLGFFDLPNHAPHEGFHGELCISNDCALLDYFCWGLYLCRKGETSWRLISEDLFIEYMSVQSAQPNCFNILARNSSSLVLYHTGDLSQSSPEILKIDAPIIEGCFHRFAILPELSTNEDIVIRVTDLENRTTHFEKLSFLSVAPSCRISEQMHISHKNF